MLNDIQANRGSVMRKTEKKGKEEGAMKGKVKWGRSLDRWDHSGLLVSLPFSLLTFEMHPLVALPQRK